MQIYSSLCHEINDTCYSKSDDYYTFRAMVLSYKKILNNNIKEMGQIDVFKVNKDFVVVAIACVSNSF